LGSVIIINIAWVSVKVMVGLEKLFHKIKFKKIQNSEKTIVNRMWQHGLRIH
jgi:hypothetical protein